MTKPKKPKSWKDNDPTAVINIMNRARGGPEKFATEYAGEAWKDVWATCVQRLNEEKETKK